MSQAEREHILAAARDSLLAALPDAWAIYVFGSFARAEDWPGSDLDLAVLLPPQRRIEDLLDVMSGVSARVHRDVDIVDLRRADDVLRREVLLEGQTLYVSLSREKAIPADLGERLQKMIGFRNIAVHQYPDPDMNIVETVITRHLDDLLDFAQQIRAQMDGEPRTDNG